jgi:hypothetical protein
MNAVRTLERAALACHARGVGWSDFWQAHSKQVRQVEPYDALAYHRLVRKLLHLLTTGEASGQEPVGEPWLLDDDTVPVVNDTTTAARLQLQFPSLQTANRLPAPRGVGGDFVGFTPPRKTAALRPKIGNTEF